MERWRRSRPGREWHGAGRRTVGGVEAAARARPAPTARPARGDQPELSWRAIRSETTSKEVELGHEHAQDEPGGNDHGRPARRDARRHLDQREGSRCAGGRAGLRRALLAACGGASDRPSAQAITSTRPRTAAEFCARQVGYWAAEALKPGTTTYGDYQTMGLTGTSYQLVLDLSEEAKRLRKTATQEQTLAFIAQEVKRRCAKAAATCTTTASYNGFPSC